jgi:hypothetical protein
LSCAEFIQEIQARQDDATARGSRITLAVLPVAAAQMIITQAQAEGLGPSEFFATPNGNVYLAGIKVLWSGGRLPEGQAWFRYENIRKV